MSRLLQYVSGVRLVADAFDPRLWHFTIRGNRFHLRTRGATAVLLGQDGTPLGTFTHWDAAIAGAQERAQPRATGSFPVVAVSRRTAL